MLHFGARPESYSIFKTGLPVTKRGDTVCFLTILHSKLPGISHAFDVKAKPGKSESSVQSVEHLNTSRKNWFLFDREPEEGHGDQNGGEL
jgi:hypothetical protein